MKTISWIWYAAALWFFAVFNQAQGDELRYGALQGTVEHAEQGRQAGWNVAVIAVAWDAFEPFPGKVNEDYVAGIVAKIKAFRALGYRLQLDFGTQYPPSWIFELPHARYRNQFGAEFDSVEPGKKIPNYVFNQVVRDRLADYYTLVFTRLGKDWDWVRLGGGFYGEVNFPSHRYLEKENCYWAFDSIAQGEEEGLARGVGVCPVPGWIPGSASPEHKEARQFLDWYLGSLQAYHDWQIATVRSLYPGKICMLYGSWGIRPGWIDAAIQGNLDGGSQPERVGELQSGYDWARMIGGIRDRDVIAYCTWIDAPPKDCDDEGTNQVRWSPVHWQAYLANQRSLEVWGENTGGNDFAAMQVTFARMKRYGLLGVIWAFESELLANSPKLATFEQFAECIRRNR